MAFSERVWKVGVFEPSAERITVPISSEVSHDVSRSLLDASPKREWDGLKTLSATAHLAMKISSGDFAT